MVGECAQMAWHIFIFLLIHVFVDDILLGDLECAAGSLLVDLGCSASRLDTGLDGAIRSARCSDIRSLLILLVRALSLRDG